MNPDDTNSAAPSIQCISTVTMAVHDLGRSLRFYRALGFALHYGDEQGPMISFKVGAGYLNLIAAPAEQHWSWWGRVIFYVADVDAFHARAVALGLRPLTPPQDAPWGERFFHLTDPDGHELSFAKPL